MADGTRITINDRLQSTEQRLTEIVDLLREIQLRLQVVEAKQDQSAPSPSNSSLIPSPHSQMPDLMGSTPFKTVRITIPRFNGGNPEPWIQKIEQYYAYHNLSDTDKLTLTSFHMDGPTEEWFLWLSKSNRLKSWPDFLIALRNRFGPSKYRDLRGELAKLLQISTVAEYQIQFETLCNQITGVDEPFLQSCFESGLRPMIRKEVRLHRPTSLDQAVELAKLIEDKIQDNRPKPHYQPPPPSPAPGILPPPPTPPFPIKRLSPAEMMERREKGLCFNCDEKFHRNHICKEKMFAFLLT